MKILKNSILAVLSLLLCYSCNDEAFIEGQASEGIQATIPSYRFDGDTRVGISSDLQTFTWSAGDAIGLYHQDESGTGSAVFTLKTGGASTGTFANSHFSLKGNSTYYAFYPYEYTATDSYSLDFTGQVQTENAGTSHVGAKNYMYSSFTTNSTGGGDIHFANVGSVMHMLLTVNDAAKYTKLTITSNSQKFTTKGSLPMLGGSITPTETSSTVTLGFGEGISLTAGQTLTANLLTAPVDLSSSKLTMILTDDQNNEYSVTDIAGKNMQQGNAYQYTDTISAPYVTFTAASTQTLTMSKAVSDLKYSVGGGTWAVLGTNTVTFGGSNGSLRLRGKNENGTATDNSANYCKIQFGQSTPVNCTGDIRTLLNYENYNQEFSSARFCRLFEGCSQLVSAPKLPGTTLAINCYSNMFSGCTSLTAAPALPATTLAYYCYSNMFNGCTSLTTAPTLSAGQLAEGCYFRMFSGCTSLTEAPALPATTLSRDCYNAMFSGCTSLATAPALPAENLAVNCYYCMFSGCRSLATAPALPATTLKDLCYNRMFLDCTSLATAPALPATTLQSSCYQCMFYGCSSLNYIKMLATDISANDCLTSWTSGVKSTGTFVKNSAATWDVSGDNGIPSGWTVTTN